MPKSTTTDPEGGVTSTTVEDNKAYIQYTRKVGRPGFSNEELSVGIPVTYDGLSEKELEIELAAAVAFVRQIVLDGLGGEATVVASETAAAAAKSKPKASGGGSYPKPSAVPAVEGDAPEGHDAQWAELLEHPDRWYNNIADKKRGQTAQGKPVNPRSPDFKRKGEGRTAGLWLDSDDTPESAKLVFSGE